MDNVQFNQTFNALMRAQRALGACKEPLSIDGKPAIKDAIVQYDDGMSAFSGQKFTKEQSERLAGFTMLITKEFTNKVERLRGELALDDGLDINFVSSVDLDATDLEAKRDREFAAVISEFERRLGNSSPTVPVAVINSNPDSPAEMTAQNVVSSSLFLQILLDWRFQVFCTALLLAASAGLAISSFGIGAIAVPVLAVQACKAGAALGLSGLAMSVVGSFFKPVTNAPVATNGSQEPDAPRL